MILLEDALVSRDVWETPAEDIDSLDAKILSFKQKANYCGPHFSVVTRMHKTNAGQQLLHLQMLTLKREQKELKVFGKEGGSYFTELIIAYLNKNLKAFAPYKHCVPYNESDREGYFLKLLIGPAIDGGLLNHSKECFVFL